MFQIIAESRGGVCLTESYVNSSVKMRWKCKNSHVWEAAGADVKRSSWCPNCSGLKRLTIDVPKFIAEERGGICLSAEYVNSSEKLLWQCEYGHTWQATLRDIKSGTWCRICSYYYRAENKKNGIDDAKQIAVIRGGKCLSRKYINSKSPLVWRCSIGHRWLTDYSNILQGSWCPECSCGRSERACRKIFELIFGVEFPKKKPIWLKHSSGARLELDGYCQSIKVAFEYNGKQHYEFARMMHQKISLSKRKRYDKLKKELCSERGVKLFEVPYYVKLEVLPSYVIEKSRELGVSQDLIKRTDVSIEECAVYENEVIHDLQDLAKRKNGALLSENYVNNKTQLMWRCANGHMWKATRDQIVNQGTWCAKCSGFGQNIIDMQHMAEKKGGACLSLKYEGAKVKLKWICDLGHEWTAIPNNIQQGSWCPVCANKIRVNLLQRHHLTNQLVNKKVE
ncbi:hypothetical protein KA078_00040 [Candidatus Woesebacteria bacterium]|nr:hypothetical protein [Candidatus Woesebacteria bacterium]